MGTSQAVALAVVVNSPGGLPVQSQIISEKLQNFASKNNLKLYTFARDVAASGGYLILSSGDHVVADASSIVGSIGVVFQKLKVKGLLDHFNVDHKQYATNEYYQHNTANYYIAFYRPTRMLARLIRRTSGLCVRIHMRNS